MTQLFQILEVCGIIADLSNDDLMDADEGFIWQCPVKFHNIQPLTVLTAATHLLGSIVRGVELYSEPTHGEFSMGVRIFLTHEYEDTRDPNVEPGEQVHSPIGIKSRAVLLADVKKS